MDTADYNITFFHDVRSKKVKWLWYPYIPYGKITLIQGDPGDGKTSFILNLIARMSNGDTLPFSKAHIHGVAIYQNAEDDIADTIKPRLERQHANCQNICFIDQTSPLLIENNSIEKAISETGAKLLVLDPLQSFMGEHIDMNRANSVRPLMQHLKKIAATTGCAIVLVGHLNKNISNKASYRGLGSIDIIAAARSVLLIGKDEENPNSSNDFGKDVIPAMLNDNCKLFAYPFEGYWKDVGTIDSLWEANMDLLNPKLPLNLSDPLWRIYSRHNATTPHYIDEKATVADSIISSACEIYGNVSQSVIFANTTVGEGTDLEYSVIMPNVTIGKNAKIQYAIIADDAVIEDGAIIGADPRDCKEGEWGIAVIGQGAVIKSGQVVLPKQIV